MSTVTITERTSPSLTVVTRRKLIIQEQVFVPDVDTGVLSVNGKVGVVVLVKGDIGLGNVDNTSDANKPISTATQSALDLKYDVSNPANYVDAAGASAAAPVQSVSGKTGAVTLDKTDVGLGNVDNTSDLDKPISTATQTALDTKVDKVAGKGLSDENYTLTEKNKLANIEAGAEVNTVDSVNGKVGVVVVNKTDVGLGNVDNTSDLDKPISTATQTALDTKVDEAVVGVANGVASLDINGKVPLSQINDSILGQVEYKGQWNASTNTPTLVNPPDSSTKGHYYIVDAAGTFASIDFNIGDWIISDGAAWGKVDNTDQVSSVNGKIGVVVLNSSDVGAVADSISTNHLLGRHSSGSGSVEQIQIGGGLELQGATIRRAALTGAITASAGSNTTALGSFTKAQLDTAISDGNAVYEGDNVADLVLATATTGTAIDFTSNKIFGSPASPETGNITDDLTGAKIGVVQKIYHNSGSEPTVPAGWVLLGSGTYTTSVLNIIYAEWVSSTRVEYWIVQEA